MSNFILRLICGVFVDVRVPHQFLGALAQWLIERSRFQTWQVQGSLCDTLTLKNTPRISLSIKFYITF